MPLRLLLIIVCRFFFLSCVISNNLLDGVRSNIEVTLITPDATAGIDIGEVDLEGLVNDLSVAEVKLLINDQEVQFVPVIKGYFSKKVYFAERENLLTIYGSNAARDVFRFEYRIINHSQREKSIEEQIAPKLNLNYLKEGIFKILSPYEYENVQVEISDNKNDIVQLAYIVNDEAPVYLSRKQRFIRLDMGRFILRRSGSVQLVVYAIDGDGNKTVKTYHFRVENLSCKLSFYPEYGIYAETPIKFRSTIRGGVGKINKYFTLTDESGAQVVHQTFDSISEFFLEGRKVKSEFKVALRIVDENGIEATCKAQSILKFYPNDYPRTFTVLPQTKFQSTGQDLYFSIEPPVRQGEITVLLKPHDSQALYLGREWKVLGREKFESSALNRFWNVKLRRKVPPGKYQMKLSTLSALSEIAFTEKIVIDVTKSVDDTEDLLQEILRGE